MPLTNPGSPRQHETLAVHGPQYAWMARVWGCLTSARKQALGEEGAHLEIWNFKAVKVHARWQ